MSPTAEIRQRQILAAASACFARKGFHQASMDDICKQAQMSPGSVYRYYRSKDDIIAAIVREDTGASAAALAAIGEPPDTAQALLEWIDHTLALLDDAAYVQLTIAIAAEAGHNPQIALLVKQNEQANLAALAGALAVAQQLGRIDSALDTQRIAELVLALIDGLTWRKGLYPELQLAGYAASISQLVVRLLAPALLRRLTHWVRLEGITYAYPRSPADEGGESGCGCPADCRL